MPPFFTLREMVSQTRARPADVLNVKRALNRMGFYDVPDYGMTPHADRTMFDGIRRFQRANGLRVDGVMRRGHATERAMNDALRLASAEKLEGSKLSLADAQRIKELEDRLKELNASIKGFQSLIRHARNAGRPVSVFYYTKEMFSRVEEKKQIEAELSRLKGE